MDKDVLPLAMVIRMMDIIVMINVMEKEHISGMMEESTLGKFSLFVEIAKTHKHTHTRIGVDDVHCVCLGHATSRLLVLIIFYIQ